MPASIRLNINSKKSTLPCKSILTIGRDNHSDLVIPELTVSRNHAMIRCLGKGDYYLIDSGSSNGSFVNKLRVVVPRLLHDGDMIRIGKTDILFEQGTKDDEAIDNVSLIETIVHDSPTIKQITIMVADIREFTSLSEQVPIKMLTTIMNRWFHDVNNAIYSYDGIVDKFIGDCVFARWETSIDQQKSVLNALSAASDINDITSNLYQEYKEQLPGRLEIGVGINTGTAAVSGVGPDRTALGDAVNIAFRMESVSKVLKKDIVMSEYAFEFLPENIWTGKTRQIKVKGKREPLGIFPITFSEVDKILKQIT